MDGKRVHGQLCKVGVERIVRGVGIDETRYRPFMFGDINLTGALSMTDSHTSD